MAAEDWRSEAGEEEEDDDDDDDDEFVASIVAELEAELEKDKMQE